MNILMLTANIGGGHIKATEAIYENIKLKNLNYNTKIINTLDFINPSFNKLITSFYSECMKKYPNVVGKMYYYSEVEHVPVKIFNSVLKILSKKLLSIIIESKIDVVIATHPFSTGMISYLKKIEKIQNVKLINLITDYAPHSFWIHDYVDAYIVGNEQMIDEMVKRNVNKEIIHPIGIPVGVDFIQQYKYDRNETLKSIDFDKENFTILLMSGSLGVNYVIEIFELLLKIDRKIQIIIVTGNNDWLYHKFEQIISEYKNTLKKFHLVKFVDNISELMNASDIIITKPGGLTTTEAIFSQLPIIFFDAVPGQEEKNGDFILKNEIGFAINKSNESLKLIYKLIDDKNFLNNFKINMGYLKKTDFIENLTSIINSLCYVTNK